MSKYTHRGYDFENSFNVSLEDNTEKDKCVKCGEITRWKKTDDIAVRTGYIEGAGQLCVSCDRKHSEGGISRFA